MFTAFTSVIALFVAIGAALRSFADHLIFKRRLNELRKELKLAERQIRQHSQLANEVAHEIKNPITAILCSAEALDLLIGKDLDVMHQQSLGYIREYGDHLLRMVSDFLDLSRAEAGQVKSRPEALPIAEVSQSIVGLLDANAIKRKMRVNNLCKDFPYYAFCDPRHFKQILFNLVHNAIRYGNEGGEVTVTMRRDSVKPLVWVIVADNGPGIPEAALPYIFDVYARYDHKDFGVEAGMGLGLTLCKRLVELAGGSIQVRSTLHEGSVFEFSLPLHQSAQEPEVLPAAAAHNRQENGLPLKGQTFLVVDEDTGTRESIASLIEAWGGMVDKVALAVDAVAALSNKEYDAVMVDDTKDGVYGYELARMMREDLDGRDTTIIVASKNPIDEALLQNSGADSCVAKPLNGEALLKSLVRSGKFSTTH